MDYSKSNLQMGAGKAPKVKLGSSASSKPASPLMKKKDYKKSGSQQVDFGSPSFGQTGLTGES
jgi:hypothetical protein